MTAVRLSLRNRSAQRPVEALGLAMSMLVCSAAITSGQETSGPDRGGFTLLLDLGVGLQHDGYLQETKTGLAGLNVGIGGFLRHDVALILRASGTLAHYPGFTQTSGVGAPVVQYWPNDRLRLEGGAGFGFWRAQNGPYLDASDTGLGLILGVSYAFFNRGKHSLQLGVEYAPAFTDPQTVQNVGIVLGWQLL